MCDVVIIGGGIAGVSLAARLASHLNVILLEAEEQLSYHASGRSAATFLKDYGNEIVRVLNYASEDYLSSNNGGVISPRGMMMLGKKNEREAFFREAKGFGLEEICIREACDKVPIIDTETVHLAAYREDVFDIDTDRLFSNFLKMARAGRVEIHTSAKVKEIQFSRKRWKISTDNQVFTAKLLVNAAGAWVDEIAKLSGIEPLGFMPFRRSIARIPVPGGFDCSNWPLMDGVNESWYAKPDAGQLIVSPVDEELKKPHDAWADDLVLAEGLARFEEMISYPVKLITSNWAGLRTFAPDRALVIGHSSVKPEFFWLAGQGGYGFQTSAAVSNLAKDLILGLCPDLDSSVIKSLSPSRLES